MLSQSLGSSSAQPRPLVPRLSHLHALLGPARSAALGIAFGLGLLAARPTEALAQTVVVTGDNLPAIVAAAADGDTLILQSNATFTGTLSWTQKVLTIKAGPGFSPRIQGSPDQPAIDLTGSSAPGTQGSLIGLRLAPGDTSPGGFQRGAVETSGTGAVTPLNVISLSLQDCLLEGDLRCAGTGLLDSILSLEKTTLQGSVEVGGTGEAFFALLLSENCRAEELDCFTTGSALSLFLLSDTEFSEGMHLRPSSTARVEVVGQRLRFNGPVVVDGQANTVLDVDLESCLLDGDGSGTALYGRDFTSLSGVNLTVVDYAVGLDVELPGEFVNVVLTELDDCLAPVVLPSQIRRSVISDGTYAGVQGNLGGKPWMDATYALLAGSIGIDHGDNSAPFLSITDLYGDNRYQDNDGDGNVRINCGAVETLGTCQDAFSVVFNGNGINPMIYTAVTEPVVGQSFVGAVLYGPNTASTLVAIGIETAPGLPLAGIDGEILLDLNFFPILHFANGTHVLPIPAGNQYCGTKVATQGFRIDVVGGVPVARAGNALKLSLGQ